MKMSSVMHVAALLLACAAACAQSYPARPVRVSCRFVVLHVF